jgi:hypothetical protein
MAGTSTAGKEVLRVAHERLRAQGARISASKAAVLLQ